jgi:hypothetical protein
MDHTSYSIIMLLQELKTKVVQLLSKMKFGIPIVAYLVGLFKVFGNQVKMVLT